MNNDYFFKKAKKQGYPARSIFKLKQINEKYKILKSKDRVLDLGCAPGSWLLYSSEIVGDKGFIVGIDEKDLNIELKTNMKFIKESIKKLDIGKLKTEMGKFDVVISDLAPSTTGISGVDAGRSLELSSLAFEIAKRLLKKKGNFVVKIFESHESNILFNKIKDDFVFAKRLKPYAIRKTSREIYIVARDFNG